MPDRQLTIANRLIDLAANMSAVAKAGEEVRPETVSAWVAKLHVLVGDVAHLEGRHMQLLRAWEEEHPQ